MTRILLIFLSLVAAGCWATPDTDPVRLDSPDWSDVDQSAEQRAIDQAQTLDRSTFDAAWTRLNGFAYTQERTVEVRDESDDVVGRASTSLAFSGIPEARSTRVISYDSTGSFEDSWWSRFSQSDSTDLTQWPSLLLPEDPLFLAAQGPSYFRYAPLADTTIGGANITVLLAEARPETPRRGIQQAKLYLSGDTLIGLEVVFVQQSLLYREVSRSKLVLERPESEVWLPGTLKVQSTVGLPFSRARTYELTSSFGNFRPLS